METSIRLTKELLCICALFILLVNSSKVRSVRDCPLSEQSWLEKERTFGCQGRKDYHCILTNKEELIEACIFKDLVKVNHTGCPNVHKVNEEEVVFTLKHSECPLYVLGCPPVDHKSYYTNQLYLYPACFLPQRDRRKSEQDGKNTSDTIRPSTPSNNAVITEEVAINYTWIVIVAFLLCALSITVLVLYKKRRKLRGCTQTSDTSQFIMEDQSKLLEEKPDTELQRQSYLLFKIGKEMLWIQIENVIKENGVSLIQFLDSENTKHKLFHQWQNGLCCKCDSRPEMYRKTLISDTGWGSLYQRTSESCPLGYKLCICQYKAKDPDLADISIATLLSFVYASGKLTNEGRRSTKALRDCCVTFFQLSESGTLEDFTTDIEKAILDFAYKSEYLMHTTIKGKIEAYKNAGYDEGVTAMTFQVDFDDREVFEVTELNFHNLPTLEARTKSFLKKDEFYVPLPRIESPAEHILRDKRLLLVTGQMGDGKSSLCRRIMRKFNAEIKIKLDSYQVNIDFLRRCPEKCLLYFEDILGISMFTKSHANERENFFRDLREYSSVSSNIFIMGCIRSGILSEAIEDYHKQHKSKPDESIFDSILDISSTWRLLTDERYLLLDRFGEQYPKQALSSQDKDKIVRHSDSESYFGFQEICVLCFEMGGGSSLFIRPRTCIRKEIEFVRDNNPHEYSMLVYILLKNEPLNLKKVDIELLSKIKGFSSEAMDPSTLRENFKFLRRDREGAYVFQHQFIREALLQTYFEQNELQLLETSDDQLIMECLRPSTYETNDVYEVFVKVSPSSDHILAKRLVSIYHIRNISLHASAKDEHFVSSYLLKEVEHNLNLHVERPVEFYTETIKSILNEASKDENEVFLQCVYKRYLEECQTGSDEFAKLFQSVIAERRQINPNGLQ